MEDEGKNISYFAKDHNRREEEEGVEILETRNIFRNTRLRPHYDTISFFGSVTSTK